MTWVIVARLCDDVMLDSGLRRQHFVAGGGDARRSAQTWQTVRKSVHMIFQDPLASLNPCMTVGRIIAEPLRTHFPQLGHQEVMQQVRAMMDKVGLTEQQINRYPHEFSGGQCQRIGIAKALVLEPKLVICDEPVSALDVSIQAQIINLLPGRGRLRLDAGVFFHWHGVAVHQLSCAAPGRHTGAAAGPHEPVPCAGSFSSRPNLEPCWEVIWESTWNYAMR